MKRSQVLILGSKIGATEESPEEAIGEGAARFEQRPQHFGDASTMGQPPRTAAGVSGASLSLGNTRVC